MRLKVSGWLLVVSPYRAVTGYLLRRGTVDVRFQEGPWFVITKHSSIQCLCRHSESISPRATLWKSPPAKSAKASSRARQGMASAMSDLCKIAELAENPLAVLRRSRPFQSRLFCLRTRASIQAPSKAVELGVEKHCFCSSKALRLMVKSSAFEEAKQVLFVMHLNQIESTSGLDWVSPPMGLNSNLRATRV